MLFNKVLISENELSEIERNIKAKIKSFQKKWDYLEEKKSKNDYIKFLKIKEIIKNEKQGFWTK